MTLWPAATDRLKPILRAGASGLAACAQLAIRMQRARKALRFGNSDREETVTASSAWAARGSQPPLESQADGSSARKGCFRQAGSCLLGFLLPCTMMTLWLLGPSYFVKLLLSLLHPLHSFLVLYFTHFAPNCTAVICGCLPESRSRVRVRSSRNTVGGGDVQ